jgi:hypothetical protein
MRYIRAWAAIAASAICAACATSTVQSVDVSQAQPQRRDGAYLTYAVAKSLILVQVSAGGAAGDTSQTGAAKPTSTSPAAGGAGAPAPTTTATAQTWTLTGTLTSGDAKPDATKTAAAKPTAVDTSLCATLTNDYQASQTLLAGLIAKYGQLGGRLAQMGAGAPATLGTGATAKKDDPATLANDVADYNNELRAAGGQIARAKSTYALLSVYCAPNVKVSIQQQIAPDWTRTFALKGKHDDLYADVINLKADSNGLFTTSSATTTDETGNIAVGIASDIGQVAGFLAPAKIGLAAVSQVAGSRFALVLTKTTCPKADDNPLAQSLSKLCVAAAGSSAASLDALAVLNLLPAPPSLPAPPGTANLPVTFVLELGDIAPIASVGNCATALAATSQAALDNARTCLSDMRANGGSALASRQAGDIPAEAAAASAAQSDLVNATRSAEQARALAEAANAAAADQGATAQSAAAAARQEARSAIAETALARFGVALELSCSPRPEAGGWKTEIPEAQSSATGGVYDGLIVSASRACRIDARQAQTGAPLANADIWVQDSRYLTRLPMQRAFLVTRTVEYDFQNGSATGVIDNRPSSMQALVALPGNIVAALIGGVTSTVTNRNALTNDQTAAVTAQINLLNARTQYLTAQKALQAASAPPAN